MPYRHMTNTVMAGAILKAEAQAPAGLRQPGKYMAVYAPTLPRQHYKLVATRFVDLQACCHLVLPLVYDLKGLTSSV